MKMPGVKHRSFTSYNLVDIHNYTEEELWEQKNFLSKILLLEKAKQKNEINNIIYRELPDWTTEDDAKGNLEWGRYLYYNVVSIALKKDFSMYFSDEPEIIENWFQDEKIRRRINIKTYKRSDMFEAISSTKIRNAFLNNDMGYIKKSVPEEVYKRYEEIRDIINKVYELEKEK